VKDFVARYQKLNPETNIKTPGNVAYNGYWAVRALLEAIEQVNSTNNHAVIKKLEELKIPAVTVCSITTLG
jgi:branched-chain amino acid transport system substrate-binding protein